jgi:serine/threonine-protein kinase SRPK3
MLQTPWGKEVDICNLGAVLPELLDAVRMFNDRADERDLLPQASH